MAYPALIQASQMALAIVLMLLIMVTKTASPPQALRSVGWHGGKKKR